MGFGEKSLSKTKGLDNETKNTLPPGVRRDAEDKKRIDMSRRHFLRSSSASLLTAVATAPITAPLGAAGAINILRMLSPQDPAPDANEADKKKGEALGEYPYTHTFSEDGMYQNMGVLHMKKGWEQLKFHIYRAIELSDIVLLERNDWYEEIAKYARSRGKEVLSIDPAGFTANSIEFLAWGRSVLGVTRMFGKKPTNAEELKDWLKEYAKTLGAAERSPVPPSLVGSLVTTKVIDPGAYSGKYDFSFAGDARTVFMTAAIEDVCAKSRGKKVLSLVGDEHAKGFEYYKGEKSQYAKRKLFYDIAY